MNNPNAKPRLYTLPDSDQFYAFYHARIRHLNLNQHERNLYSTAVLEYIALTNLLNGADASRSTLRPDPLRPAQTWATCIGELNCTALLITEPKMADLAQITPAQHMRNLIAWFQVAPETMSAENRNAVRAHMYENNMMSEAEATVWEELQEHSL